MRKKREGLLRGSGRESRYVEERGRKESKCEKAREGIAGDGDTIDIKTWSPSLSNFLLPSLQEIRTYQNRRDRCRYGVNARTRTWHLIVD